MTDKVTDDSVETKIDQYLQLRERVNAIKEIHKKELAPLQSVMEEVLGWLQKFMDNKGISEGVKTKAGTAYLSTTYSATLSDPKAFMDFVIANKAWELMDKRANSPAVKEYVENNAALPPGCNLTGLTRVNVRKA